MQVQLQQRANKLKMSSVMSSIAEYLPAVGFLALPLLGGYLSGRGTKDNIKEWYEKLNLPWYRPPNWIFAPVWSVIYSCMGASSYLIWREGGFEEQCLPLAVYGGQLLLNLAWTPIFFGQHRIGLVCLLIVIDISFGIKVLLHLHSCVFKRWSIS